MRVYVTKYALTKGIFIAEMELSRDGAFWSGHLVDSPNACPTTLRQNECHVTMVSALARVRQMRIKQVDSLRKKISKLNAIDFNKQLSDLGDL